MSYFSRRNYEKLLFSFGLVVVLMSGVNAKDFQLDKAHTSVNFKIKHMKISNVLGKFSEFDAQKIDFDPQNKKLKSIEATINTASIDTGIKSEMIIYEQVNILMWRNFRRLNLSQKR